MMYEPMHIEHIRDVLPHVEGRRDFAIVRKDGYTVIDYLYVGEDTFDHRARLECRGLKFDADGPILARPFQKFFNLGERAGSCMSDLDLSSPHIVMDKRDGSMVHPAILDGETVFMTRMGRTDVARACEEIHLTEQFKRAFALLLAGCFTPILEWTAPQNRIVIPYAESQLTLLAVRHNVSGAYVDRRLLPTIAGALGVPLVSTIERDGRPPDPREARSLTGVEGYVVLFPGGHMVKAKAEEYVLKHRAKESVLQEKVVLQLILRGEIDDVLPLLDEATRSDVEAYRAQVMFGIAATTAEVEQVVAQSRDLTQKEFAIGPAAIATPMRAILFAARAGIDAREAVTTSILKQASTAAGVNLVRPLFGAAFRQAAANDNAPKKAAA